MKNNKLFLKKDTVELLDSARLNDIVGGRSDVELPWEPMFTEQYHCTFTVMSYYFECPATEMCSVNEVCEIEEITDLATNCQIEISDPTGCVVEVTDI